VLRLHGAPGGPTSITGTARLAPTIFYIVITQLSGHTQVEVTNQHTRPGAAPEATHDATVTVLPAPGPAQTNVTGNLTAAVNRAASAGRGTNSRATVGGRSFSCRADHS
jgi:hypothetical protein